MSSTVLRSDLKERHVNMMAFSACLGFGLFLQSGLVVYLGGPGLAVLAFLLACSVMWAILGCLGEMTALYPIQGPLFDFPGRFIDEAVGYATGWTSWFAWTVTMAAQLTTIASLWNFHFEPEYLRQEGLTDGTYVYPEGTQIEWGTRTYSPAVWAFIFFVIVGAVNFLPVRAYGETAYIFGVMKMLFICGIIVFNIFISAVQPVRKGNHFWTWNKPWGFAVDSFPLRVDGVELRPTSSVPGDGGRFVGLWTGMTTVITSLVGIETLSLTAPEQRNLQKSETMKIGTKKLVMRLTILYTLATFAGGLNVPYDDWYLRDAAWGSMQGGQNSIFVLAAVKNNLVGWAHFFNGFFIFSSCTAAMNSLYNSSRLLHAMASIPEAWPLFLQGTRRRLERTTSRGVPLASVVVSWMFGLLAFLSIRPDSSRVLGWLAQNATVSCIVVYAVMCASYLRFYERIKSAANDHTLENRSAFNRTDSQYPYRTRGQLFRAVYGLSFCLLILFFNGWRSFVAPFSTAGFVTSYISVAVFVVITMAYHIRTDGWNPLGWRARATMEIQRPPPVVVIPGPRKGVLNLPNQKTTWTEENVRALMDWIWVWVK